MSTFAALLGLWLPLADAPNPAYCPNHDCGYSYHQPSAGGLAAIAIVGIVVGALVVLIALGLFARYRRRRALGRR